MVVLRARVVAVVVRFCSCSSHPDHKHRYRNRGHRKVNISIIIPVLNEQRDLSATLNQLQSFRLAGHEIIVVDGGSSDHSLAIAHEMADVVLVSKAGRALQMNNGAAIAKGDVFLFLHADTVLPHNAVQLMSTFCTEEFWGRFDIRLSSDRKIYRLIEYLINWRSRLTSIATGDQAIFIDRRLFNEVGGFPEISLMEDIALSRRLKETSRAVCLRDKVITSSRRWEQHGVLSTILLMWRLRLYYYLGASPEKLSQLYR
jgi:rSAM/selenodomain-associated transferase 2